MKKTVASDERQGRSKPRPYGLALFVFLFCVLCAFVVSPISGQYAIPSVTGAGRSAPAGCTITENNKGAGADGGSATTATVATTINATGDAVLFSAWCETTCTFSGVTLGSQSATQTANIGSNGAAGQIGLYYIASTTVSGAQTATLTVSGTHTDVQIGYVDFGHSAGSFAHDVDSAAGSNTSATANTPSITPSAAGELLYVFTAISNSISSVNAPWTQGTIYPTSSNADGYILSSASGATANNMTLPSSSAWVALSTALSCH